jgi:pimeloyl-ACP methyl ester carboxylesterase
MSERLGHDVYARLSSLQRPSDLARLDQIRCESLVVCAEHDQLRSLEESQELETALHAELAVIQGSGHMIPLERPRDLASTILQWLERRKRGEAQALQG